MIYVPVHHMQQDKRGFTLVETLVAITVLVVAIVGPLYVVHKSIIASFAARDKLIATALAQEGVEYVRSIRDDNYLANRAWLTGLNGSSNGTNSANCFASNCTVDQGQNSVVACPGSGCAPLHLSNASLYTQVTSHPVTNFTRSVRLSCPSGGTCASSEHVTVTVTVSWRTSGITYTSVTTEQFYNWL